MKLTIPKDYYPGDAEAAKQIALKHSGGHALEVVVSKEDKPYVPTLEHLGRVASGVAEFKGILEDISTEDNSTRVVTSTTWYGCR